MQHSVKQCHADVCGESCYLVISYLMLMLMTYLFVLSHIHACMCVCRAMHLRVVLLHWCLCYLVFAVVKHFLWYSTIANKYQEIFCNVPMRVMFGYFAAGRVMLTLMIQTSAPRESRYQFFMHISLLAHLHSTRWIVYSASFSGNSEGYFWGCLKLFRAIFGGILEVF